MTIDECRAPSPEDRRKHLDFIQAIVTRMSSASTTTKGWLLPVVTLTYGYALTKNADSVALLGAVAVILFAFLDAHYLRTEKAYRRLYDCVARGIRPVPPFSLDPSEALDPVKPPTSLGQRVSLIGRRWVPDRTIWGSWSIAPFYGSLLVVGLLIAYRVS